MLVDAGAVEVGPPDRTALRPVDVVAVHSDRLGPNASAEVDEGVIDAGAVDVGPRDHAVVRGVVEGVCPVDVGAVGRHPIGAGRADKALVDAGAVEVGPPDLPAALVRPEHVRAIDRHPLGGGPAGDKSLVDAGAVEVGSPDRAAVASRAVRPIDEGIGAAGERQAHEGESYKRQPGTAHQDRPVKRAHQHRRKPTHPPQNHPLITPIHVVSAPGRLNCTRGYLTHPALGHEHNAPASTLTQGSKSTSPGGTSASEKRPQCRLGPCGLTRTD